MTARIRSPRASLSPLPVAGADRGARTGCDDERGASSPPRFSACKEPPRSPTGLFVADWPKKTSSGRGGGGEGGDS